MPHTHTITDNDAYFAINSVTREITTTSSRLELIQGDHQSERITFEIPRFIEGHDMSLCNRIKINYTNTDKKTKATKKGIYIADDATVESNKVLFSWLMSSNVTKYYGSLEFLVSFECMDGNNEITYKWSTQLCSLMSVGEGLDNAKSVAVTVSQPDVLENFKNEISEDIGKSMNKILAEKVDVPQTASVGDVLTVEEVDDNGKPTKWKAATKKQANWEQNDSTAEDYVQGRTHWVEHDVLTEILPETTFEVTLEDGEIRWWTDEISFSALWAVGDKAIVTVNGTEYNLTVYDLNECLSVGNAYIVYDSYENTGEPFFMEIYDWNDEGWQIGDICFNASGTYTVSVKFPQDVYHAINSKYIKDMYYTEGTVTHTVPEKFIPSTIARTDDIVQSDWSETNDSSLAYIRNKPHKVGIIKGTRSVDYKPTVALPTSFSIPSDAHTVELRIYNLKIDQYDEDTIFYIPRQSSTSQTKASLVDGKNILLRVAVGDVFGWSVFTSEFSGSTSCSITSVVGAAFGYWNSGSAIFVTAGGKKILCSSYEFWAV